MVAVLLTLLEKEKEILNSLLSDDVMANKLSNQKLVHLTTLSHHILICQISSLVKAYEVRLCGGYNNYLWILIDKWLVLI